jgi:hypothetical protein
MRDGEKGEIKERLIYSLLLLNKSAFSCVFFFIKGFIVKLLGLADLFPLSVRNMKMVLYRRQTICNN